MMRKLFLVPIVLATAFLTIAFVRPSIGATILRAVPGLHGLMAAGTLGDATVAINTPNNSGPGTSQGSSQADNGSKPTDQSPASNPARSDFWPLGIRPGTHAVATAAPPNCGRFGSGFHGGKHNFACPNHPFPPPAVH